MPQPKGKDFKLTSDAVCVADMGFKRQLWALDPELDVIWDWGEEKWEVWRFPGQAKKKKKKMDEKAKYVMRIQTKDRTFRELGADILLSLQKGDPKRFSVKEIVAYLDALDDNLQRAKEKATASWIEAAAKDTYDYIRGVVKRVVPGTIKPHENRLLIKVPNVKKETMGVKIFKTSNSRMIANAVRE